MSSYVVNGYLAFGYFSGATEVGPQDTVGAFTFDGTNKIISLVPGTTEISCVELYSRWVEWCILNDNFKYLPAIRTVGGDTISPTKNLGLTFFLINGWRVRPQEASHSLRVNGNLYTDPAGFSPFVATLGAYNVMIEVTVSSLVDSSLAQLPEIEQASFNGRVAIDVANGEAGTAYPIGTQASPVNNLADALSIAATRGFDVFYVLGNLTIGATDNVSNKHFHGQGATLNVTKTLITFIDGCVTSNASWHNLRVTGKQGGESNYIDCIIDGIWNAHCHYQNCGFILPTANPSFTIQHSSAVGSTHITDLHDCYSDEGTAVIDRNGTGLNQIYIRYSGRIKFINQNKASGSGTVWINMNGGTVTVAASCTTGGFVISGNCTVVNESGGATVDVSQVSASSLGSGPTVAEIAAQVRLELAAELAALDAPVSTRATPGDIFAAV